MLICGFQKLTLLDYPGKVACTVFTGGCNYRCPFCHNASLVLRVREQAAVPEREIFDLLEKRRGLLDGICVSGGEPLLQPGLGDFLGRVRAMGLSVKLDTNGSLPQTLKDLVGAGLIDYVAMDIKSSPERYPALTGIADTDVSPVLESAAFLMKGSLPFEFRTTLVKELHAREDMEAIGRWLSGAPAYFLQSFRDSGDLIGTGFSAFSNERMQEMLQVVSPFIPNAKLRGIE
ncbi:MAG: anaerobic ribonucleoside-triphosphate reductase activating protein [Clostridiales bacterium]|nr:anaerobic ribonucleoside-triphosphate reductase activating protein [Clostridiales bacterium]